jgi:hypothetical protein
MYQRFRILEETSIFADGSRRLEYALQGQQENSQWDALGSSKTLEDARRALLFLAPRSDCWLG